MRSVDEHRAAVLDLVVAALPPVTVSIGDSLRQALAADVVAEFPLPRFDNSSMDGYAVRVADLAAVPLTMSVTDELPAGTAAPRPLQPGSVARIMTGAPIPEGADAVVQVEFTDGGVTEVRIDRAVDSGTAIRYAGEDVKQGTVVLCAGEVVSPAVLGLLASLGIERVAVNRRPRVAICVTGDELREAGPLPSTAIYDSNTPTLLGLLRSCGFDVAGSWRISDDVDQARTVLTDAAAQSDVVITTGGISAGAYEVIKLVCADQPAMRFCSVAVQPGKPQGYGNIGGTPVICLPGNPLSVVASFVLFVLPMLKKMAGYRGILPMRLSARIGEEFGPGGARDLYLLGALGDGGIVRTTGPAGSHRVGALGKANCLIAIPAGSAKLTVGDPVEVIALPGAL